MQPYAKATPRIALNAAAPTGTLFLRTSIASPGIRQIKISTNDAKLCCAVLPMPKSPFGQIN